MVPRSSRGSAIPSCLRSSSPSTGWLGGILVFYLTLSPRSVVRRLTDGYISFFIGTPLIVLLFLMYYGLPQWGLPLSPLTVAVLGFTLNVAAYNARYLRTAYNGLDQQELEAARAQGFSGLEVFRYITLPQTLRLSVPALTNQAILNLKDSSVAFLIQYTEFFAEVQELATRTFSIFQGLSPGGSGVPPIGLDYRPRRPSPGKGHPPSHALSEVTRRPLAGSGRQPGRYAWRRLAQEPLGTREIRAGFSCMTSFSRPAPRNRSGPGRQPCVFRRA
jgi:polar amino acid transport system permease protein